MKNAVILDAVRTPIGRFRGGLAAVRPDDMGALVLKALVERGAIENDYIENFTEGWEAVEADLAETRWDSLTKSCGVPREQIEAVASMLAESKRGIFCWAMGLTHHVNGVDNILALSNVALACGWLGRPGCGLMPNPVVASSSASSGSSCSSASDAAATWLA